MKVSLVRRPANAQILAVRVSPIRLCSNCFCQLRVGSPCCGDPNGLAGRGGRSPALSVRRKEHALGRHGRALVDRNGDELWSAAVGSRRLRALATHALFYTAPGHVVCSLASRRLAPPPLSAHRTRHGPAQTTRRQQTDHEGTSRTDRQTRTDASDASLHRPTDRLCFLDGPRRCRHFSLISPSH